MTDHLTATERKELKSLISQRAKVETNKIKTLIADRIVEADRELNRRFSLEDMQIREIANDAKIQVDEINAKIEARCDELGVHRTLRPNLRLSYNPGGYQSKDHRSELRREARLNAEAAGKRMAAHIEAWKLEALTELVKTGLTSDEGHRLLTSIPDSADQLPRTDDLIPQIAQPGAPLRELTAGSEDTSEETPS